MGIYVSVRGWLECDERQLAAIHTIIAAHDDGREIAALPASDDDGDRVTGLFFASRESSGMNEWQIRDGEVFVTPGRDRYRYLDS